MQWKQDLALTKIYIWKTKPIGLTARQFTFLALVVATVELIDDEMFDLLELFFTDAWRWTWASKWQASSWMIALALTSVNFMAACTTSVLSGRHSLTMCSFAVLLRLEPSGFEDQ